MFIEPEKAPRPPQTATFKAKAIIHIQFKNRQIYYRVYQFPLGSWIGFIVLLWVSFTFKQLVYVDVTQEVTDPPI